MRRRRPSPNHKERWLVSYSDLLTLLFAFFTTLYALSTVDAKKAQVISNIQQAFHQGGVLDGGKGVLEGVENAALINDLQGLIPKEFQSKVTIREESRGIIISLADSAFFASGSAQLQEDAQRALGALAQDLNKKEFTILVEGHTDDLPVVSGRYKTNWELSTARATAVVLFFIERHNYNPQRLSAAGYGQYRPISTNLTPEGRASNRRVDLVLQATPRTEKP